MKKCLKRLFFRRAKISLPNPVLRSGALRKIFFCARAGTEQWREGGGLPPFLQWKIYWAFSVFSFSGFLKKNFPKPPQFLIHLKRTLQAAGVALKRARRRICCGEKIGSAKGRRAAARRFVCSGADKGKIRHKKAARFSRSLPPFGSAFARFTPADFFGGEYRRFYGQSTCSEQLLFFLLT